MTKDRVEITTLPNGFRIVTERMPGLKSASLGVWVGAGCRHERLEQNGIAHFLEHMAFKGTARRSALDIAEAIEDVGGFINAYTSREMTAYYVRVLEDHVPLAMDVVSDIVLNSTFDPKELEVERGVILQEIHQSIDTPDDIIFDWLQDVSFPDQPMGRPILGPAERVSSFSRDDLNGFVAEHYGPEQMILAAAGSIDHDALVRMAGEHFGGLKPSGVKSTIAAAFRGGDFRREKDLEQAHMALAFDSVGYREDDIFTAQIYAMALGGGMSSRLFQEAREKRGLCYTIYAQASGFSDAGLFTIYAGTSAEDIGDLANLTLDEIKRSAEDMSGAEIDRAAAQLKAGLLMSQETPSSRTERLARMISIWGRVPTLDEVVARIDDVGVEDVMRFAEKMRQISPPAAALYGPIGKAPSHDDLAARLAA